MIEDTCKIFMALSTFVNNGKFSEEKISCNVCESLKNQSLKHYVELSFAAFLIYDLLREIQCF